MRVPFPEPPAHRARLSRHTRSTLLAIALVLVAVIGWSGTPSPALASSDPSMEASILDSMNRDRLARGLRSYRLDGRLRDIALEHADAMVASGVLSHWTGGRTVCDEVEDRSIAWYSCGEDIGTTDAAWGPAAADWLYGLWRASPSHWAAMMSPDYNYVGIAFALRSDGSTYASIVFLEGPDRTRPSARMTTRSRSGTTVRFGWAGSDPRLQTHTAGLRNFDVRYRVDRGTWRRIRTATTATSITLRYRAHRHSYWISVRSRDGRGNASPWSTPFRVWVP